MDISMAILLTPEPKTDNVLYISFIYSGTISISSQYKQGIIDAPVLTSHQNVYIVDRQQNCYVLSTHCWHSYGYQQCTAQTSAETIIY